ncbi:MAG: aldolase [Phycisphaeraceae bacterium]|nr:aldolase [Phycisphaeraceae bacterium]
MAGMAGFDAVWIDTEHLPHSVRDVENFARSCRAYDIDCIVRTPHNNYTSLIRPLEAGATGLLIPHVMTADQAESIVRQTRFHPLGRRSLDGASADNDYGANSIEDYMEFVNKEVLIAVQIEDPEAMAHLEAIARVPGIDMLFFGPADYSQGLGKPGQLNAVEVEDARREVARAAVEHEKAAGTGVRDIDEVPRLIEFGYNFVNLCSDTSILRTAFNKATQTFKERTSSGFVNGSTLKLKAAL